jgi:hypothetical protein
MRSQFLKSSKRVYRLHQSADQLSSNKIENLLDNFQVNTLLTEQFFDEQYANELVGNIMERERNKNARTIDIITS